VDIDECDAGTAECGPVGQCTNTRGSWRCVCVEGAFPDRRNVCKRPTWRRLPDGPSARRYPAMAYDRARGTLVLYGGESLDPAFGVRPLTDTWEWNGSRWESFDAGGPGWRTNAVMAYDEERRQLVLFGGAASGRSDETWTWDGAQWRQLADAGPGLRVLHSMSFDPMRRQVLLFGGAPDSPSAETWGWDGTRWSKLDIQAGTSLLLQAQMFTQRRTGEVLLYTGLAVLTDAGFLLTTTPTVDNLLRLEGTAWTRVPNTVPGPSTIGVPGAWSDDGFIVLLDVLNHLPQTWVWDGAWHGLELVGPPQRIEAGAATAPDGGIIVCGGVGFENLMILPNWRGDCWWFGL